MALIELCADKGSPGVTTTALALAEMWPGAVSLVEADPSGGDLALRLTDGRGRFDLADQPSLLTFAAAARRQPLPDLVWRHCQTTSAGIRVLRGLTSAEQAGGLERLWPRIAETLAATGGGDVLADLGRLQPGGPALPVAAAADVVVVVAHASAEGLVHLRERAYGLLPAAARLAAVLVASDRYGHEAVRSAAELLDRDGLPATVVGFIAIDARAVSAMQGGVVSSTLDRSMLLRTAAQVAQALRSCLNTPAQPRRQDISVTGHAGVAGLAYERRR